MTNEEQPLLPIGFHSMDLQSLRDLCVGAFDVNSCRGKLMDNLTTLISNIRNAGVKGEVWIDGSFMTTKINPRDVDMLLYVTKDELMKAGDNAINLASKLANTETRQNLKDRLYCDSYVLCDHGDSESEFRKAYWMRQFGFDRDDNAKGIAVIKISEMAE